ncbi:MAG: glycosyltransferase family 2 protein [Cyanobacteriota bacterium]
MINNHKIAVVIPAYNEGLLITSTIEGIPAYVDYIIVVDDSSEDNTSTNVREIDRSGLILLTHNKNYGAGRAIVSGYKEALLLNCDIVAVMAGDGQMCPGDLLNILAPIIEGKANYSKGNRFISKDCILIMPKLRVFGNFCFSIISCIASGYYHIFDTQCGYTAIDKDTLLKLDLNNLYFGYGYPTDFLARLGMIYARVVDVPVKAIYNTETSGIRPLPYTLTIIQLAIKLFIERQIQRTKRKLALIQNY